MKYDEKGLIPAIAQDSVSGEILMVAWMNQEALSLTIETKHAWFWSRSRQELWHKGATSGSFLTVERILTDCDSDVILLLVRPAGPACHTGERSCFFQEVAEVKAEKRPYAVGYVSPGLRAEN